MSDEDLTFQEFCNLFVAMYYKTFRPGYMSIIKEEAIRPKNKEHFNLYASQVRMIATCSDTFQMVGLKMKEEIKCIEKFEEQMNSDDSEENSNV